MVEPINGRIYHAMNSKHLIITCHCFTFVGNINTWVKTKAASTFSIKIIIIYIFNQMKEFLINIQWLNKSNFILS